MRVPLWFIIDVLKTILKVLMYLILFVLWIIWRIIEECRRDVKKALLIPIVLLIIASVYLNSSSIKEYFTPAPQPTLALPLSKYEGKRVSMMYPTGWGEIEEEPDELSIDEPLGCGFIYISWEEWEFEISGTAEDRYREEREAAYSAILELQETKPQFELLRESRLGEAPVFEYQFWDEENASIINREVASYIDVESRQYVIASWNLWDLCGVAEWNQAKDFRHALFDTVMQSIAFK